jgi:hypothetical protein
MKNARMLSVVVITAVITVSGTPSLAQEEAPLEPIPAPAPLSQASVATDETTHHAVEPAGHETDGMPPLVGPGERLPLDSRLPQAGEPVPPSAVVNRMPANAIVVPDGHPMTRTWGVPVEGGIISHTHFEFRPHFRHVPGVVVYRAATYASPTPVVVRTVVPPTFGVVRGRVRPLHLVAPYPPIAAPVVYAPPPLVPGQPIRNAIRARFW